MYYNAISINFQIGFCIIDIIESEARSQMTSTAFDGNGAGNDEACANSKHLTDAIRWRCLNCGQNIFVVSDTEPPDICQYCKDMTTWQLIER